jgi:hypothetical protein
MLSFGNQHVFEISMIFFFTKFKVSIYNTIPNPCIVSSESHPSFLYA